jgi:hypothetical protein
MERGTLPNRPPTEKIPLVVYTTRLAFSPSGSCGKRLLAMPPCGLVAGAPCRLSVRAAPRTPRGGQVPWTPPSILGQVFSFYTNKRYTRARRMPFRRGLDYHSDGAPTRPDGAPGGAADGAPSLRQSGQHGLLACPAKRCPTRICLAGRRRRGAIRAPLSQEAP